VVAGAGGRGSGADQLFYPGGVAVDGADNLFVADSYNHRVLKITPDGAVTTVLGTGFSGQRDSELSYPRTVATGSDRSVFVADSYNHRVLRVSPDGKVTLVAGRGGAGSELTQLSYPRGVAADSEGNVFVSDNYNHRVLRVSPEGIITVAAGGRGAGDEVTQLNYPFGIAVDAASTLFIGDAYNHRVQTVTAAGVSSTLLGAPGGGGGMNQLVNPVGVDVDAAGNVYVSDTNNHRIQKVSRDGVVTTIWGGEGAGAGERQLNQPFDTATDSRGNLYIADTFNHRVLKVTFPASQGAPQVRHAATNRPAPGTPNLLMRLSPPQTCPEPLSILVGGYAAEVSGSTFTIPEAVDPAVPTEVYVLCQTRNVLPALPLAMTPLQPRLFAGWTSQLLAELTPSGRAIGASSPAQAGDYVALFGTGFGTLAPADANGRRRVQGNVTATVGGVSADVLYAGTAAGQPVGLTQINVRIPQELKAGLQPVVVFVDGEPSQGGVVLPVAP
jgi:uncharacterized protein (TIGR03437 family)